MSAPRAFTLIELLVVVAIIAILAGILFPVFAHAQAKARQTDCVSNLKQLGLAMRMYTQDHDEFLPNRDQYNGWWFQVIGPYVKNRQVFGCRAGCGAPLTLGCLHVAGPCSNPGINCYMSYASAYPAPVGGTLAYTYGTDGGSGGLGYYDTTLDPSGKSLAAFQRPADTILLGDGLCLIWHPYSDGWESWYRNPDGAPHNGGRNFVYVDMHAKWSPANRFNGDDFRIR
jgi:prepilin-type N-terminal cleavage/methylation domain-containing protein/prepilin-type processing-associated H-X9-DG protein